MNHNILVIDTSYSMREYVQQLIAGINRYIYKLKAHPQQARIFLTIVLFNDSHNYLTSVQPVSQIQLLQPEAISKFGATRLFDTIQQVIHDWIHKDCHHNMYIITDGADNISKSTEEETSAICSAAINSGNWSITHCHTDISMLSCKKVKTVVYSEDNLEQLIGNLTI